MVVTSPSIVTVPMSAGRVVGVLLGGVDGETLAPHHIPSDVHTLIACLVTDGTPKELGRVPNDHDVNGN